jgi:hypothetical protein
MSLFSQKMFRYNYIIYQKISTVVYLINEDEGSMYLQSTGKHLHGMRTKKATEL